MNLKTVYVLFGTLVAVLLVFGLLEWLGPKSGLDTDWVLPALHEKGNEVKSSDIDRVELSRYTVGSDRKEEIVFARQDGTWVMEQPFKARVQTFAIDGLVDQVIRARREKSEVTHNLAEAGLKTPYVEATLFKGDQSWKLMTSKPSSDKASATVNVVTGANPTEPAVVKSGDLEALFKKNVNEYRAKELIAVSSYSGTAVDLKGAKGELALEKTGDGQWRFKKPAYGAADFEGETASPAPFGAAPPPKKEGGGVRDLLDAVTGLRVEGDSDFVAEGVADADLAAKYGLAADKPETLRVEVAGSKAGAEDKKKETSEILLIGKKVSGKDSERKTEEKKDDKDAKKDEKKDDKTEYYYACMDGENAVVRLPAAKVDKVLEILAAPDKLRERSLVQADLMRVGKLDALDLKNSSGLIKLRKGDPANSWKMYRDGSSGQAAEQGSVPELIDAMTRKKAVVDFPSDKEETLEFDKPAAVVSIWFDGVQKEEKKDDPENKKDDKKEDKKGDGPPKLKSDKPAVTLTFGKRDRDKKLVYVRREAGDDKTIVRVEEALLDRVTVSPLAFAERKLPTFSEGFDHAKDVTKLALNRGNETFEIAKEKNGDKAVWKFTAPEALKGRTANEATVISVTRDLATLRPDRLVAEKASDADLDTIYGLKTPSAKATVTVTKDGKAEDWVYLFGKNLDGDKTVYAKQGPRDVVFVVPRATVEPVLTGDLRDPTVLSFDPTKVKSVKLSGWKDVAGVVVALELERKGDKKWDVKAPAGFTADPDVVDNFVAGLTNLRASRFVTPKTGTKTGLDVNEGALKVEVTVEGQEKPLELTVGAEDADNKASYFARSGARWYNAFGLPVEFVPHEDRSVPPPGAEVRVAPFDGDRQRGAPGGRPNAGVDVQGARPGPGGESGGVAVSPLRHERRLRPRAAGTAARPHQPGHRGAQGDHGGRGRLPQLPRPVPEGSPRPQRQGGRLRPRRQAGRDRHRPHPVAAVGVDVARLAARTRPPGRRAVHRQDGHDRQAVGADALAGVRALFPARPGKGRDAARRRPRAPAA